MSVSTILIIACSVFGVIAFLGVVFLVMKRSRQVSRHRCREERQSLNLREVGEPQEPQQVLYNPTLSGIIHS